MTESPIAARYVSHISNPIVSVTVLGLAGILGVCYCTTIIAVTQNGRDLDLRFGPLSADI